MKKALLFIILLFNYSFIHSQLDTEANVIMENINPSLFVAHVDKFDMDYDNDLDLVSVNSNMIIWYENNDSSNSKIISHYIPAKKHSSPVHFLKHLDINGDGYKDLITHDRSSIYLYEGLDKKGNFSSGVILVESSTMLNSVTIGDIDNDGDKDIIFSHEDNFQSYQRLKWLENIDSKGNFETKILHSYTHTSSLSIFDTNMDGFKDIVSYDTQKDNVDIFINNGNQEFSKKSLDIKSFNMGGKTLFSFDIDKDLDIDLLVINSNKTSQSEKKIELYKNDGNGNFSHSNQISTGVTNISTLEIIDIDKDNDFDLLFSSSDKSSAILCVNDNENFENKKVIDSELLGDSNAISYDFDNDGNNDIIVSSSDRSEISWYKNIDNDKFIFDNKRELTHTLYVPTSSIAADLDGDNDLDVVTVAESGITWYENIDGEGSFGKQKRIASQVFNPIVMHLVDIDGDNDLDLVTGDTGSNYNRRILLYKNADGKGGFDAPITLLTTSSIVSISSSDIDNDGDNDIIYCNEGSDIKYILNIDGHGSFESNPTSINTSFHYQGTKVTSSDIDNDKRKDIIAYNPVGTLAWYKNNNGKFETESIIYENNRNEPILFSTCADLDNDKDIDIITAIRVNSSNNCELVWFENLDAKGNFSDKKTISSFTEKINSISVTDVDNDNDNDIVTSHPEKVAWFENTDGTIFLNEEQVILSDNNYINRITIADFNKDLKTDFLYTTGGDTSAPYGVDLSTSKVQWLENKGILKNEITGFVTLNSNNDCTNADGIENILVTSTNGNETLSTFTYKNGFYQLFPNLGNYTTEVISPVTNLYTSSPVNYSNSFSNRGNLVSNNFCISKTNTLDKLSIDIIPLKDARPGFEVSYKIVCKNIGTEFKDGTITFNFDDKKLSFLSIDKTIKGKSSNSVTFDFKNLAPFKSKTATINFRVLPPPTVNIDDVLSHIINVTDNSNNTFKVNYNQTVIGSYDPNDILVLEGKEIYLSQATDYLHYTIRFQNTGTASAINVKIENEINEKLDWNSLKMINSSHDNRIEISNGSKIKFIFNNINLPDSISNEPKSHGFVSYKIKPKKDAKLGDIFTNNADIFFDFNPPIRTNTVSTKIVEKVITPEESFLNTHLYPNPSKNKLFIETNLEILSSKVFNNIGQLVHISSHKEIDISKLAPGIYYLIIQFKDGQTKSLKFIKI